VCLFDEGDHREENSDTGKEFGFEENVDVLVEKLAGVGGTAEGELVNNPSDIAGKAHATSPVGLGDSFVAPFEPGVELDGKLPFVSAAGRCGTQGSPVVQEKGDEAIMLVGSGYVPSRRPRHTSCPPSRGGMAVSGPWSFEWLRDHRHGEAGILFSSTQKHRKSRIIHSSHAKASKRKKVGGVLRHTLKNLKKVARLQGQDRREVIMILEKKVRK
jgi:hypothetical protein